MIDLNSALTGLHTARSRPRVFISKGNSAGFDLEFQTNVRNSIEKRSSQAECLLALQTVQVLDTHSDTGIRTDAG